MESSALEAEYRALSIISFCRQSFMIMWTEPARPSCSLCLSHTSTHTQARTRIHPHIPLHALCLSATPPSTRKHAHAYNCTHLHKHSVFHAHTHLLSRTNTRTPTLTCTHTLSFAHTSAYTHTYLYTPSVSHTHIHPHLRTNMHTPTLIPTHTHALTRTHTHLNVLERVLCTPTIDWEYTLRSNVETLLPIERQMGRRKYFC